MTINELLQLAAGKPDPGGLREDLQHSHDPEVILRRAVVGASVVGIAAMTVATLYQSGFFRKLPDPPQQDFDSNKVNASKEAFSYGSPDGPISILAHAFNMLMATAGNRHRARFAPWLPLTASIAALPAALTACKYLFYQMPVKEKAWCGYCVADALSHIATFGFTLYESSKALTRVQSKVRHTVH